MPTKGIPIRESAAHRKAREALAAKRKGGKPPSCSCMARPFGGCDHPACTCVTELARSQLADKAPAEVNARHMANPSNIMVYSNPRSMEIAALAGRHIVLVGDIVSGFEAFGPFDSGTDAVRWKQEAGVREFTQGQWFLLPLKEAK